MQTLTIHYTSIRNKYMDRISNSD